MSELLQIRVRSHRFPRLFRAPLRTKFLLSLALISALLTWATLLLVQYRVRLHVKDELTQELRNSVLTFHNLQQQRESTLERSAALLATLPPLKAVMTSQDPVTIQDASAMFWELAGSQLFVLADRSGRLAAMHTTSPGFTNAQAQDSILRSLRGGDSRDWWFGNGRLFEVFLQPIYFGSPEDETPIGLLAVGYEIDNQVATDVARAASSQVAFRYDKTIVSTTVPDASRSDLSELLDRLVTRSEPAEIKVGSEAFLATTVPLDSKAPDRITLTVLKSFDQATAFLQSLNRWILLVGLAAVFAGSALVFVVSTTFTRPLAELANGVQALERGDFNYPLKLDGGDEISELTSAFQRMRLQLQETQQQLLEAERLATIGRMASTISHDLRHPLTAILAYAEFLSDTNLTETQRRDFFDEIRIAVNRMTDEISSLLGFSKQREPLRPAHSRIQEIIERTIQTVRVLPDFSSITIAYAHDGQSTAWLDPRKLERVMLNLLFNACEAVSPDTGRIEVTSRGTTDGLEVCVSDNGRGVPEAIRSNLFQPFVSYGKEKGIGLGLTVVQKVMRDHGGEVNLEQTGPTGSTFKLFFPAQTLAARADVSEAML